MSASLDCLARRIVVAIAVALLASSGSATTLDATPDLRNSPEIAVPDRVKLDPSSGAATFAYKFALPPGTAGMTPDLMLSFSTLAGGSEYGYGWSANLPFIERCARLHQPFYNDPSVSAPDPGDEFELEGDLLVRETSNQFHRRYGDGSRILYDANSNSWEVTKIDGTRLVFGGAEDARLFRNPVGGGSTPAETFRWALSEVIDPRGNSYRIHYFEDWDVADGVNYKTYVYPDRIEYSHSIHASATPEQVRRLVTFAWGPRANPTEPGGSGAIPCDGVEDCPTSYRAGFKVQRRFRLDEVAAGIDADESSDLSPSEQSARFELAYYDKTSWANPELPAFSQLASIQRYGEADELFPSSTQFEYSRPTRGFVANPTAFQVDPGYVTEICKVPYQVVVTRKDTIDLNGDGFLDRVWVHPFDTYPNADCAHDPATPHEWRVLFGSPSGFTTNHVTWTFDCEVGGTGLTCEAQYSLYVRLSVQGLQRADLVDMDGDGLPDRVLAFSSESGGNTHSLTVHRNTGSGFGPAELWDTDADIPQITGTLQTLAGPSPWAGPYRLIADVSGDGRPDYISEGFVFENTGSRFGDPHTLQIDHIWTTPPLIFNTPNAPLAFGRMSQLIDINGDGLADYLPERVCLQENFIDFNLGMSSTGANFLHENGQGHSRSKKVAGQPMDCLDLPAPGSASWPALARYPEGLDWDGEIIASMVDINGDGIRDYLLSGGSEGVTVYFGLGDGRFLTTASTGGPGGDNPRGILWDIGSVGNPPGASYPNLLAASNGSGVIFQLIDWNGDGLPEHIGTEINPGPDTLLTGVTNELGGKTTIQYAPSTAAPLSTIAETGLPPEIIPDPRSRWVGVGKVTSDGRAGTPDLTEDLRYGGFRFDSVRRESLAARNSESDDAAGLTTRRTFHQMPEFRGKLEVQEQCAGVDCFSREETEWTDVALGVLPGGAFLARPTLTTTITTTPCDDSGDPACGGTEEQVRAVDRTFDAETGLLLREEDAGIDGDLLQTADNLVRVLEYAENSTEWMMSYVGREATYFGSEVGGILVSETRMSYDATSYTPGVSSAPVRCSGPGPCGGLVSFRDTLRDAGTGERALERWAYDDFGNMIDYFDPVASGGATPTQHVTYGVYNTFPVSIQNALLHEHTFLFEEKRGEVTRALNPSGYLRCWDYDAFGRLESRGDHDAPQTDVGAPVACTDLAKFTFHDIGFPAASQRIEEELIPGGSLDPVRAIRYFDGLGREYQSESEHRAFEFDVVTRGWGSRGEQVCESLPFRRAGGLIGSAPVACNSLYPRRETSYDSQLRPTLIELVRSPGNRISEIESQYRVNGFGLNAFFTSDLLVEERTTIAGTIPAVNPSRIQYFGHDNRGETAVVRDGLGADHVTLLERDIKGRITRVDGPDVDLLGGGSDANLMEIAYNAVDQRTALSQPITPGDPQAPTWQFTYDANGDLYEQTSPRGVVIRFHHDVLRRMALIDYGVLSIDPSNPGPGDIVHEYYGPGESLGGLGQLKSVYGRHGIVTDFDYDLKGRLATKTRDFGGTDAFVFSYTYDGMDRPLVTGLPDDGSFDYTYDGAQLVQLEALGYGSPGEVVVSGLDTHPSGGVLSYEIDSNAFSSPPVTAAYSYDSETHRLASATTKHDPYGVQDVIQDFAYAYDRAGNLRTVTDVLGTLSQEFYYDDLHRLLTAKGTGSQGYVQQGYVYDPAGNLLEKGPVYTTDAGRLKLHYDRTAGTPTSVTSVDFFIAATQSWWQDAGAYSYDADGGTTAKRQGFSNYQLIRNADGQVYTITLPAVWPSTETLNLRYDHTGARAEKLHLGTYATVLGDRYYVDETFEVDTVNDTYQVHVFAGSQRMATIERNGLGTDQNGTLDKVIYHHPDHVGSNTLSTTTNASGQTTSAVYMDPFGQEYAGSAATSYLFTDQERDSESGLDYFGARYYDSWIGRFMSQDPELIGGEPGVTFGRLEGDAQNGNAYAYVLNRPTGLVDPTGAVASGRLQVMGGGTSQLASDTLINWGQPAPVGVLVAEDVSQLATSGLDVGNGLGGNAPHPGPAGRGLSHGENWNIGRRPEAGEFFLPPDARAGLNAVFGAGATIDVRTIRARLFTRLHLVFIGGWNGAVTRPGRIYTTHTPEQFSNADWLVLHEYFHVVNQWNRGMTVGSYFRNSSSVEAAASAFADQNLDSYRAARQQF